MSLAFVVLIALLFAAPGLRLLRSAMLEPREPELWLGSSFVLASAGLALRLYSVQAIASGAGAAPVLPNLTGHFSLTLGAFCLYIFVWRVFHHARTVVMWLVMAVGLAISADLVWIIQSGSHAVEHHASIVAANALRGAALPWVFFESLRYRRMMLRRGALGIGDPVVANRFALWAIWSGALSVLPIFVLAARVLASRTAGTGPQAETLIAVLPFIRMIALGGASAAIVCIWLSFFPPNAYIERLRRIAAAA